MDQNQQDYLFDKTFVQHYIRLDYNLDLVARFINAFDSHRHITYITGFSQSTLTKLSNPDRYNSSSIEPSARRLWNFLSMMTSEEIKTSLSLTDQQFNLLSRKLGTVDYSASCVVCDQIWLKEPIPYEFRIELDESIDLSTVIQYLKSARGSIWHLNMSRNFLFDAGLKILLEELTHHTLLRELNIDNTEITEVGLEYLSKFVQDSKREIKITCKGNYADCD